MRWVRALFLLVAIFVVIIFSLQNQSQVVLRFAFPLESRALFEVPKVPLPLFLVVLCAIFLGVLIGGVGDMIQRFQLKRSLRKNQKKMEMLEREMQSLRGPGSNQSSSLKEQG
ncbi:MAG TPA: LapA family protein [Thermodesulfobacteriota bacterium]|nr:LapA family protein [Thermodesulfobacteriota bacterium]